MCYMDKEQLKEYIWENLWMGQLAPEMIGTAIKKGFDPNELKDEGTTILHASIIMNEFDCVKVFCENGADVNLVGKPYANGQEMTPLMTCVYAGGTGAEKVAQKLIEHGAKVHKKAGRYSALTFIDVTPNPNEAVVRVIREAYVREMQEENQKNIQNLLKETGATSRPKRRRSPKR